MQNQQLSEAIEFICKKLEAKNPAVFRVAFAEKNDTEDIEADAKEFLKVEGIRCGRDFKLYDLMAKMSTAGDAVVDAADTLMHIKTTYPEDFSVVIQDAKDLANYFDEDLKQGWVDLWEEESCSN